MNKYMQARLAWKKNQKKPLYKPLKVTDPYNQMEFNQALIDTCHMSHQGFMAILDLNFNNIKNKTKMDYESNKNSDYVSARMLYTYFYQWLKDMEEMQNMAGGE